jgi:hypothetical protein
MMPRLWCRIVSKLTLAKCLTMPEPAWRLRVHTFGVFLLQLPHPHPLLVEPETTGPPGLGGLAVQLLLLLLLQLLRLRDLGQR